MNMGYSLYFKESGDRNIGNCPAIYHLVNYIQKYINKDMSV